MSTVMIVDDSLIIRMSLKKIFEKKGLRVVAEAQNGREAFEKYCEHTPDITTMDITMPEMDGLTALAAIRGFDKSAKVVMISALGQELKIIDALNKGAKQFIVKPFREDDVINRVMTVLETGKE